jgi:Uma2 family endonuclease
MNHAPRRGVETPGDGGDAFCAIGPFARMRHAYVGFREELVHGRAVRESSPGEDHGRSQALLRRLLDEFVEAGGLGLVTGHTGCTPEGVPDTVRGPSQSFMAHARLDRGEYPVGRYRGMAPDLAVEIVSRWNPSAGMAAKVHEYLLAGVRLVWVVDPSLCTVTVHRPESQATVLRSGDELDGGDVLPGFRVPLARLFDR